MDDHRPAATPAAEAGALLRQIRDGGPGGDRRSNELVLGRLTRERPDDAVPSEEAADDPVHLGRHRVWIVDPPDGTRE
jgi:3'(2'), 5'-bisphosphate nucleotidase